MQLFLAGYILIELCEIFTVGLFPLNKHVRVVSRLHSLPTPHHLTYP